MIDTAGRDKRKEPGGAGIRQLAEDAKHDLEELKWLGAEVTAFDRRSRKLDRTFTIPAAILLTVVLLSTLAAWLYFSVESPIGTLIWIAAVYYVGIMEMLRTTPAVIAEAIIVFWLTFGALALIRWTYRRI